jgi:aspartyl/asparaginyl-tRNA synthetase
MHEIEKIKHVKLNMKNYERWLELRRYGSAPHPLTGIGKTRLRGRSRELSE